MNTQKTITASEKSLEVYNKNPKASWYFTSPRILEGVKDKAEYYPQEDVQLLLDCMKQCRAENLTFEKFGKEIGYDTNTIYTKPLQAARRAPAKQKPKGDYPAKKKVFLYLKKWDEVFEKWGWQNRSQKEKSELRREIRRDVLEMDIEPSEMSNGQWDVMFFAIDLLLSDGVLVWSPEMAAYAREEGWRRVYIHWIENAGKDCKEVHEYGAPEEYIAHIARDQYGTSNWRMLESKKLKHLFWTIKNRVRKAAGTGDSLYKDKPKESGYAAVNNDNCPF